MMVVGIVVVKEGGALDIIDDCVLAGTLVGVGVNENVGTAGFGGKKPCELEDELEVTAIGSLSVSCCTGQFLLSASSSCHSRRISLWALSASRLASSRSHCTKLSSRWYSLT